MRIIAAIRAGIRAAGFRVGWMTILPRGADPTLTAAYAVCPRTGRLWCVISDDEERVWLELARSAAGLTEEKVPTAF